MYAERKDGLTEASEDHLGGNGARHVASRIGKVLGQVGRRLGSADGKGTVEYADQERDAVRPSGYVGEIGPDEAIRGMLRRHRSHHDDRHENAPDHHESAEMLGVWNGRVEENIERGDEDRDQHEGHVVVPGRDLQIGVVHEIHLDEDLGHCVGDRGQIEQPSEEVDGAGEEAHDSAMLRPCCDGSPMVHAARAGNGRCEFR